MFAQGPAMDALSPDLDGLERMGGCYGAARGYAAGNEGAVMGVSVFLFWRVNSCWGESSSHTLRLSPWLRDLDRSQS